MNRITLQKSCSTLLILLIFSFLMFLTTVSVNAQVTVGGDTPPENYAILQLESSVGGLRLSQLTSEERNDLSLTDDIKANGLLIFNTTDGSVEYWKDNEWHSLLTPANIKVSNGLEKSTDGTVSLGGGLDQNTTINLTDKNLAFVSDQGIISINNTAFSVVGDKVGIGTDVPTNTLHIGGDMRVDGLNDQSANTDNYNRVVVTNSQGHFEYITLDNFVTDLPEGPEIKTIKYVKSTGALGSTAPTASVTTLGNLSIRLNSTGTTGGLQLQYSFLEANTFALHYFKTGASGASSENNIYNYYVRGASNADVWTNFPADINASNRDIATAMFVLNNSKQVYRVSLVINAAVSAIGNASAVPAQITIFIEKLGDE